MREIVKLVSGKPRCPNHGCPLEGIPWPAPLKGQAVCPVSGAHFAYEIQGQFQGEGIRKDKFGNLITEKVYKVTGQENDESS
jgi:hypothetical protein